MWRQILLTNRRQVLKSINKFEKVLAAFREALETGDEQQLVRLLQEGKRQRDAVGN
jgi:prephenate dehydrogenase